MEVRQTTKAGEGEKKDLTASPTESTPQTETKPQENEVVFFNVMPRGQAEGKLVQPTLKATVVPTEAPKPDFQTSLKKYKWIIIGIALLIIGGPIIFFIMYKLGSGSDKSGVIILKQPTGNNVKDSSNNSTSTNSQIGTEFTTTKEWQNKYFPGCSEASMCGDDADPDHDGLSNAQEFKLGTDPNNNDSDQDGISDGDEVNVFGSNPLSKHTASDKQYTDTDYIKGGYDFGTGKQLTPAQISAITEKMKKFGLHQPTIKSLDNIVNSLYNFSGDNQQPTTKPTPTKTATSSDTSIYGNMDQSIEAKQDRDAQRSNTIKSIEGALVKYHADNKNYPVTSDFVTMFSQVKPYLKVATNPADPIDKDPFVYSYVSDKLGTDFTLTFYSEVAGQAIKKHSEQAIKDSYAEQAAIYDQQRIDDLDALRTALLLYSHQNIAGTQDYVFPGVDKYKSVLIPEDISQIPKDPKTGKDYEYKVSPTFDTFTLKATLDAPEPGTTGWMYNQEECKAY